MSVETHLRLADGDHVVQFYDADDELVGMVAGYLDAALLDGDAVVVIASPAHRQAFETALTTSELDTKAAVDEGRLVVLDAAETLSEFMVDGMPDAARFDAVVGATVRSAAAGGAVRAYGEMVAVLWEAGSIGAAIAVEELWNELSERIPFSLFCAYPGHLAADPDAADSFSEVCHLHSHVLAGAPSAEGAEVTRRFVGQPQASGLARKFVTDTLIDWDRNDLIDDAVLVVAELTSNAVVHARSDLTVALTRRDGGIRVEVGDSSAAPPQVRDAGSRATHGRGLQLISAIACGWGHSLVNGGKLVWVDLCADARADLVRTSCATSSSR